MKLSPFMKKVEVEGGYRGFYRLGVHKITFTVEDNGVGVYVDSRSGIPMESGSLKRLFKPMTSLWAGKKFVESIGEPDPVELPDLGFIELSSVEA